MRTFVHKSIFVEPNTDRYSNFQKRTIISISAEPAFNILSYGKKSDKAVGPNMFFNIKIKKSVKCKYKAR